MISLMKANWLNSLLSAILLAVCFSANAKTYLVSVGIADYSKFPQKTSNLRLPAKDAQAIVNLYTDNTSVDYAILLNDKATKDRIVRAINKVFNMASERDIVVFFFSGHGYPGGFCAYDGNLAYKDVLNAMAKTKSKHKMMFVDACRAGGIRVDAESSSKMGASSKNADVMLFLSSRNTENSIERKDMKNGFFTTYLENGLIGNADANKDRKITAKELFDFVSKGVARISNGKQHPVMWGKFDKNMIVMEW